MYRFTSFDLVLHYSHCPDSSTCLAQRLSAFTTLIVVQRYGGRREKRLLICMKFVNGGLYRLGLKLSSYVYQNRTSYYSLDTSSSDMAGASVVTTISTVIATSATITTAVSSSSS